MIIDSKEFIKLYLALARKLKLSFDAFVSVCVCKFNAIKQH